MEIRIYGDGTPAVEHLASGGGKIAILPLIIPKTCTCGLYSLFYCWL